MAPVRQLLTSTKLACQQELAANREGKDQRLEARPEVIVEVAREILPKLSEQEELQVIGT